MNERKVSFEVQVVDQYTVLVHVIVVFIMPLTSHHYASTFFPQIKKLKDGAYKFKGMFVRFTEHAGKADLSK